MAIYSFEGHEPAIDPSSFVHPEATLIGAVFVGPGCIILAGARLRADWGEIHVGPHSNIQENCVLHLRPGESVRLGPRSHIGHGAIVHGALLEEHVTVGMGAILQDGVRIGPGSLIGAGAVLLPGMEVPGGKLVVGVPARVLRDLTEAEKALLHAGTDFYEGLVDRVHSGLKPVL